MRFILFTFDAAAFWDDASRLIDNTWWFNTEENDESKIVQYTTDDEKTSETGTDVYIKTAA